MGLMLGKITVETPKYEVVKSTDEYEIRQYAPAVIAEVTFDEKKENGFLVLANYIGALGKPRNTRPEKIAMTAPVVTKAAAAAEKIAMTAPVVTTKAGGRGDESSEKKLVTMQFILPSKYKKAEEAPRALDERVVIRDEEGKKLAVVTFSGVASEKVVEEKAEKLRKLLERDGETVVGEHMLAGRRDCCLRSIYAATTLQDLDQALDAVLELNKMPKKAFLVVEDSKANDADILKLTEILGNHSFETMLTNNYEEVKSILLEGDVKYDVVIIDRDNGPKVAKSIREMVVQTVVIGVIPDEGDLESIEHYYNEAAANILRKPLAVEQIESALKKAGLINQVDGADDDDDLGDDDYQDDGDYPDDGDSPNDDDSPHHANEPWVTDDVHAPENPRFGQSVFDISSHQAIEDTLMQSDTQGQRL
ncbi:Heme-binding-like protein [Drosera capensis]